MQNPVKYGFIVAALICTPTLALAQDTPLPVSAETGFILDNAFLILCAILALLSAPGFAMFESGLVRAHNAAGICLKIIALYAIAALSFYIVGYNIMYTGVDGHGLWGSFTLFYDPSFNEMTTTNHMARLFFAMSFAGIAAAIVSGALAERLRLWPFLIFTLLLSAFILPLQGAWSWGGGWLNNIGGGFKDFAGASVLHSVGGWCALTGALILGPRLGKFTPDGRVRAFPGSNIPLATLGALVLWVGWLALSAGALPSISANKAIATLSLVMVNTHLAAAAGCLVTMLYAKVRYGKPDITIVLNGALAGLVSISGCADIAEPVNALFIGGLGGALCGMAVHMFDKLKIDDVVGALPVHLVGGLWGTLAVALFCTGDYQAQLTGMAAIGAFSAFASAIIWLALRHTVGIRVAEKDEHNGTDRAEIGVKAYPDFEVNSAG